MTSLELNRSERIRAALFDDLSSDILYTTSIDNKSETCVLRLSEPAQMIKLAIEALINYQNDADLATSAVPELLKLLNDEDEVVVNKATLMVHHLSKSRFRHALINSPQMVSALLRAMSNAEAETTTCAASILHNLSQHQQGLLAIFKSDGISALIKLLTSPINRVVYYSLTTIYNLLLHQEGSKMAVRLAGGIQKMVTLLNHPNPKFLALLTECLTLLAYGNQESKLIILASGGVPEIVNIMLIHNYEKLLWTTSRLLKVLSVCQSNKLAIIQAGGIYALDMHLEQPGRLQLSCLWALRNLSDSATDILNIDHLLQVLLNLLKSEDLNVVVCSVAILSNLTCNNTQNKLFLCQLDAIEKIVTTIKQAGDRQEIVEPAICVLKHLTHQHEEAEIAQNDVRLHDGLNYIVNFLNLPISWSLIKGIVGLIHNLAQCPANQAPLREAGVIPKLNQILSKAQQERNSSSGYMDGVKIADIIEGTMYSFKMLARDVHNRSIITEMNLISTFVQLLYCDDENVQQSAVGVLSELSLEKKAVDIIESEGATAALTELLHSRNEVTATFAAAVLYRMSEDKPQDYKKRLSLELTATLFRDEPNDWTSAGEVENEVLPQAESHYGSLASPLNPYPQSIYVQTTSDMDVNNPYSSPYYNEQDQVANNDQYSAWYDTDL
ncbi:catenin beta-1-like [Panonychus citri]|uniref:catenin beta-1-like n=1 Tax=Panonychus citri TaxID=50023 RepID=UPI002307E2E4|nr:catenin beta-1-like [Panonychus citri]